MASRTDDIAFTAILDRLDDVSRLLHKLHERVSRRSPPAEQQPLWEDRASLVLDTKSFMLELLERARWRPEPSWPRVRRELVDELEGRLRAVWDTTLLPEPADIEELEWLLYDVEAQTCALLRHGLHLHDQG
jgi:hypothetical protein